MSALLRPALVELLGTFTLVFVGGAAVASGQPLVVPALAHGLIVVGLIYAYGHVCGTHINPAVTAGLLAARQFDLQRALAYWCAQFMGGIVAALVLALLLDSHHVGPTVGSLTITNIWAAAAFECVLTFFLVSAIFQAAVHGHSGQFAALAVGLTLVACILAGGPFTGASLNPARTLGPALVDGNLSYVLPYFAGTFGGAVLAGLLHSSLLGPARAPGQPGAGR